MADRSINELPAAQQVTPDSLFVLQQSNAAKKLTAQILENWLVSFADGHGGIQSIVHQSTSGLEDTYRITLADTTAFDFTVSNGKGIAGIQKTGTSGLVDTYQITYNDRTSDTYTVTNGEKGDMGDNAYVWIRYASQQPTSSNHSFGVLPDDWMGVYSGNSVTAPADWQAYQWFQIKGEKGNTGDPATVLSSAVEYLVSDSGTIIPSGSWQQAIPAVAQGRYLWTRVTTKFNTGSPIVSYSVSRYGIDGSGAISTVNQKSPDSNGNVQITAGDVGARPNTWVPSAADIGALSTSGGAMTGEINMGSHSITGLSTPTADSDATNKAYTDTAKTESINYAAGLRVRNLLDNSDFLNPVNQRNILSSVPSYSYFLDRWINGEGNRTFSVSRDGLRCPDQTTISQRILNVSEGEKVTFAAHFNDGQTLVASTTVMYKSDHSWVRLASAIGNGAIIYIDSANYLEAVIYIDSSKTVSWAAVYPGEYTSETLPPYVPKGYAAELAECQRYFYRIKAYWKWISSGVCISSTQADIPINLPQPMRIMPTVTIPNPALVKVKCGGNRPNVPTEIQWTSLNQNFDSMQLTATVVDNQIGEYAVLYFDNGGEIQFSADL